MTAPTEAEVAAWVTAAHERWAGSLTFRELRRGASAVSDLYVHKRQSSVTAKVADGRGKHAAFIVYYGGLHLLLVADWLRRTSPPAALPVVDVGCGPGVVGAAVARWCGAPSLLAGDVVGRHLQAAAWTAKHFGVPVKTRRGALPGVLRGKGPQQPTLYTLGWVLNELDEDAVQECIQALAHRVEQGHGVMVWAPLSTRVTGWWSGLESAIRRTGVPMSAGIHRCRPERPPLIADLDRATRLKHDELGGRVLYAPPQI